TASRLIFAGCKCRKTFERIASERLRGSERSCETRKIDFQTCVCCGSLYSFASSSARSFNATADSLARVTKPTSDFSPVSCFVSFSFPSAISWIHPLTRMVLTSLQRDVCARIVEFAGSRDTFFPFIKLGYVHDDLTFGVELNMRAIHRARRGPFEVDRLTVVTAAVTGALKLVFARLPVRGATQMRAARVNHKQAIR